MLSYVVPATEDKPNPFRPLDLQSPEGEDHVATNGDIQEIPRNEDAQQNSNQTENHVEKSEGSVEKADEKYHEGKLERDKQRNESAVQGTDTIKYDDMERNDSAGVDIVNQIKPSGEWNQTNVEVGMTAENSKSKPSKGEVQEGVLVHRYVRRDRMEELSEVVEGDEGGSGSPVSDSRSTVSDSLVPTASEDRCISKFVKPSLKRVSFGSSKGSMVETLIYDSAIAEDRIPEEGDPCPPLVAAPSVAQAPIRDPVALKFGTEVAAQQRPASKVRVTFFQSERPLVVTSPEPSELDSPSSSLLLDSSILLSCPYPPPSCSPASLVMASASPNSALHVNLDRQLSSESGRDNPFRPDGDISREADQIVQLIKSGKPLLENSAPQASTPSPAPHSPINEPLLSETTVNPQLAESPPATVPAGSVNGTAASHPPPITTPATAAAATTTASAPATVEVTHTTVAPTEATTTAEHVVLKKKNKCACCVIQ